MLHTLTSKQISGQCTPFQTTWYTYHRKFSPKENWIWDILEIDWTNVYLLKDHKEINLVVTVVIPIYYKYKLRQLLRNSRKDPLHLYLMLKHRESWLNLKGTKHEQIH